MTVHHISQFGIHVRAMNPTIANNTGVATSSSRMMTDTQSNPKHVLVQKLQGAMQNLRREREQEYREKVEAEERLRLATEEQASLATIVAGLKAKQENLRKRKTTVESNLVQLEADVKDLTDKVQFQHNELLGARAKIQQQTREMEEATRVNQENLDSIQQLAHERSLKATAMTEKHRPANSTGANQDESMKLMLQQRRREGLERELNCIMMFEWESFPKLMEEKSRIYMEEAQFLAQLNEQMTLELGRRGITVPPPLATNSSSTLATPSRGQDDQATFMQLDETTL